MNRVAPTESNLLHLPLVGQSVNGVFAMFRLWDGFDPQAIQIFVTESGFKQHAKTQITIFGFEVEIEF